MRWTLLTTREDSLNVLLSANAEVVDDFADEVRMLRNQVAQLRGAMELRAPIEQARGMFMMRYGLSADRAFRLLLRCSRTEGVELRVFAVRLVNLGIDEGRMTDEHAPAVRGRAVEASSLACSDTTGV